MVPLEKERVPPLSLFNASLLIHYRRFQSTNKCKNRYIFINKYLFILHLRCLIASSHKTHFGRVYFNSEFRLSRVHYEEFFGNEHRESKTKRYIGQLCPTLS